MRRKHLLRLITINVTGKLERIVNRFNVSTYLNIFFSLFLFLYSNISCKSSSITSSNGLPLKIPLIDYILNVMKFVDAILSNNSTDDHCREFVAQGGLRPLLRILSLPNLPVDSPITASAQAVAAVCKSILVSVGVWTKLIFLVFNWKILFFSSYFRFSNKSEFSA